MTTARNYDFDIPDINLPGPGYAQKVNDALEVVGAGGELSGQKAGAVGDGVGDDGTLLNSLIDVGRQAGEPRKLKLTDGVFKCPAGLNLRDLPKGLVIEGEGGAVSHPEVGGPVGTSRPATTLLLPASSGSLIDWAGSLGIGLRNLNLEYDHAAYAGDLVVGGWSATEFDPAYLSVEHCTLGGRDTAKGARTLFNLNKCLWVLVQHCNLGWADRAFIGVDSDYANVVSILSNAFHKCRLPPVYKAGEMWAVEGNGFEPLQDGTAGAYEGSTGSFARALSWFNWHGDASVEGGRWMKTLRALGAQIGGIFGSVVGNHPSIEVVNGTEGLAFSGWRNESYNFVDFITATARGIGFTGGTHSGAGTAVLHPENAQNWTSLGNKGMDNEVHGTGLGIFGTLTAALLAQTGPGVLSGELTAFPTSFNPVLAWLNAVGGFTNGSLGIFPRTDIPTAEVLLFGGDSETPSVRVGKDTFSLFGGTPATRRAAIASPSADVAALKTAVDALRQVFIDFNATA